MHSAGCCVCLLPVSRDAQMFVEQSTQEFRVLLVVCTTDLANTVEGAEGAGVSFSSKHHHLVRVDMHSNVLEYDRDTRLILAHTGWIIHHIITGVNIIDLKCGIALQPHPEDIFLVIYLTM